MVPRSDHRQPLYDDAELRKTSGHGGFPPAAPRRECRSVMTELIRLADRKRPRQVYFSRPELMQLLALYSRQVSAGEWRDYAIDHKAGMAIFSVFRHSFDRPLFSIAKWADAQRPSSYAVFAGPRRLKAGGSLLDVLAVLEGRPKLVGA